METLKAVDILLKAAYLLLTNGDRPFALRRAEQTCFGYGH